MRDSGVDAAAAPYWPELFKTAARIEQDGIVCASSTATSMSWPASGASRPGG